MKRANRKSIRFVIQNMRQLRNIRKKGVKYMNDDEFYANKNEIIVQEITEPGVVMRGENFKVEAFQLDHTKPCYGYKLTEAEEDLIRTLRFSFMHSQLLKKHVQFLYSHGGMYRIVNENLLYHGCIRGFGHVVFGVEPYVDELGRPKESTFSLLALSPVAVPRNHDHRGVPHADFLF